MAISRLLDLPTTRTLWCIAYVICLTLLCASAFPVKKAEDYGELYDVGDGRDNLVLKEERRDSAPMWFHRAGKAVHSAPMWFNRMSRSGEYNPEGIYNTSILKTISYLRDFHNLEKKLRKSFKTYQMQKVRR